MPRIASLLPLTLLICLLALTAPVSGQADADPHPAILEELINTEIVTVTGASKYEQELVDAPAFVSIVTGTTIRRGGYRTLADVLAGVTGFYTTYNRSYHLVGVRGLSPLGDLNTRILLLVDGHRLNDGVYEQAPLGSDFPLDLDLIEQVEIIRGTGSSLYGTNAFLAVINVVTRKGRDMKGGRVSLSGGSYESWSGRVSAGGKSVNGIDYLISGSYRDSGGKGRLSFPEYGATDGGIARDLDGERTWDLLAKVSWGDFSLLVLHQERDKDVPTAPYYSIFNDPAETILDRHTLAGVGYNRPGAAFDLNARLTYNRYEYRGDYPLDYGEGRTLNRDRVLAEWVGCDLFVSRTIGDHLLTVGTEQRWQFTQEQRNFDVSPVARPVLDDSHRTYVQGYYLQDEFHILKNLILNGGVRVDVYENFGESINPRAALLWKARDSTLLRLTYGEAFRAPNAYELYYDDQASIKGNRRLHPEKNRTLELGWSEFFGNNLSGTLNGFYIWTSDLLEQVTDPHDGLEVFTNRSRVESRGVELQLEGKWENGWSGLLGYSFQDVRSRDGENDYVPNSPHTLVKGKVTAPLPLKGSFATLEMLYGSSRLNASGEKVDGAAVVNLTLLNRDLVRGLELSASVYNLLDSGYAVPAGPEYVNSRGEALRGIGQDGVTFRIKATYRF